MNKTKPVVSVVIPVFNEKENIKTLLSQLAKSLRDAKISFEIICVDDNSTDGTYEYLQNLKRRPYVTVVRKKGKKGKAFSLLEGFALAQGTHIVMIDGDMQYPPQEIPAMLQKLTHADIVVSNRKKNHASSTRRVLSTVCRAAIGSVLFGLDYDVQSGLKVFKREVLSVVDFSVSSGWTFDLEFLLRAQQAGYIIASHDIVFNKREFGKTNVHLLRAAREIVIHAIKLKFKKKQPVVIAPSLKSKMVGAGVGFKKKKYITHTSLPVSDSALVTFTRQQKIFLLTLLCVTIFFLMRFPLITGRVIISTLTAIYTIDLLFNFVLMIRGLKNTQEVIIAKQQMKELDENALPVYSILSPLYKESHVIPQFLGALERLDYPKEKLDVLLLLEEDDTESIQAVKKMDLPSYVRTVVVPDSQPKTKPKACNYGLSFARGEYLVVYDAEDIPEPQQLKKAILGFQQLPRKVICLQAKLNYYNPHHNLLTRFFTAEYSLWFDMTLPGLQGMNATIPLGGTSNHFRTKDLRDIHGWDPFNVTEDADLGVRLFKDGYKTAIIDSTTYEEANSNVRNWFRQRSRWLKGYMQTYLVHMRDAFKTSKTRRSHTLFLQLTIGGKLAFILINPLLWILTISYFAFRSQFGPVVEQFYTSYTFYFAVVSWVFGNFLFLYYYMIGCAKREQWTLIKYIFFVPIYWLMISIAACIAFFQLLFKPHYWEKTIHGFHLGTVTNEKAKEVKKATRFAHIPQVAISYVKNRQMFLLLAIVSFVLSWYTLFVDQSTLFPVVVSLFVGSVFFALYIASNALSAYDKQPESIKSFPQTIHGICVMVFITVLSFIGIDALLAFQLLPSIQAFDYVVLSLVTKTLYIIAFLIATSLKQPLFARLSKRTDQDLIVQLITTALVFAGVFSVLRLVSPLFMISFFSETLLLLLPYMSYFMIGLTGYACASVIYLYYLQKKVYVFSFIAFLFCFFQLAYVVLFYESIDTIVQSIFITGILQLISMVVFHLNNKIIATIENNFKTMMMFFERTSPVTLNPEKMRILFFNWRDSKHIWAGGAEVYIEEIAKRWVKDGNSVTILCGNDGRSPRYQTLAGVRIIRVGGAYTVYIWSCLFYLLKLRGKFDVIIDCENGIPFFTPLFAKKPIFLLIHHIHREVFISHLRFPLSQFAVFLETKCMPYIYKNRPVITVSNSSKSEILKLGFVSEDLITIVHNGIEQEQYVQLEKTKHPSFMYLGRLQGYKNVDLAIKAFAEVYTLFPQATLAIVGWGESLRKLKKLVKKLDIEDSVTFYGRVSEKMKAKLLAKSWVVLQPSRIEGWGITVIEANASRTPVIASRVNGLKDAVVDGRTGILVEPGNSKQFTESMLVLIYDSMYREKLSDQALIWAHNFDWEKSAKELYFTIQRYYGHKRLPVSAETTVFSGVSNYEK